MFRSPFLKAGVARFTGGYKTASRPTHEGIDYAAPKGTPLVAIADGVVKSTKSNGIDYGKPLSQLNRAVALKQSNYVILVSGEFEIRYFHLHTVAVRGNQKVKAGDTIGTLGNTGYSSGPHLHLEIKKNGKLINPSTIVDFSNFNYEQNNEMISLPVPLRAVTTNTIDMNVRTSPSTSAKTVKKIAPNSAVQVTAVASGSAVNGITAWYQIGNEMWISGAFIRIEQQTDTSGLQGTIANLQKELKNQALNLAAVKAAKESELAKALDEYNINLSKTINKGDAAVAALQKDLVDNNLEIEKLRQVAMQYNIAIVLPPLSETGLAILEESIDVDGWLNKWAHFVDTKIKSNTLKSILKYDIFVIFGIGLVNLSVYTQDIEMQGWQQAALSGTIAIAIKLVSTRYDTNKDGVLNNADFVILKK